MEHPERHVPNSVRSRVNRLRVEHERPFGKPSSRFLVIPVMCDQASFLFSFQMDPRSQSAGMTDESVMPDMLYTSFC